MKFVEAVAHERVILTEGSFEERLKRDGRYPLDPHIHHANWIADSERRVFLEAIWRGYLDVGREFNLPMIILTPTWRANRERAERAGLDVHDLNTLAVKFLLELRESYDSYAEKILIGGLIGPRGDAYNPAYALAADEAYAFHLPQLRALAAARVDFLMAATLPALSEAVGIGEAMNETGCPGIISVVLRKSGTLLDGMPLSDAVDCLDSDSRIRPFAHMINCTHPSVFAEGMTIETKKLPALRERVLGLQANSSPLPPEELNDSPELLQADPDQLAEGMIAAHRHFGLKILGGCCGTDERHIRAIAQQVKHLP